LPKLNRLNIKTQIINTINIPDIIDQMLYPESVPPASVESGKSEPEPATAPVIADVKEFNELVNGAVIDSAAVDDDSAGKLIVVIIIYYYYLLLLFIIIKK
jgi:hypothetical protein